MIVLAFLGDGKWIEERAIAMKTPSKSFTIENSR
jgi:hypothetical protein